MKSRTLIEKIIRNPVIQTLVLYISGSWIVAEITQYLTDNFDLSDLFIGAGAHVYLGDFQDSGNRAHEDRYFPDYLDEALYVDTLYLAAGSILNLNGLHLYYHNLISEGGQIIDFSIGQSEPIPEPSTILLLGSGLIGFAGFRRKKFKR